jgi:hypothetical protein
MPDARCPMPDALCTSEHVTEKGYRKPAFVCGSCFPPQSSGRLRNSGELADCCVHHKLAQVQSRYF